MTTSGGAQLVFTPGNGSVLDGVTVNGDMDVGRSSVGAWARITNGLVLNGTLWLGSPTNASTQGYLTFQGITPSLSGSGTVVFGASLNSVLGVETLGATLTIGPGISVRGQSGYIGSRGGFGPASSNARVVNQGTVSADVVGGTLTINGQGFSNQGLLIVTNGAGLSVQDLVSNAGQIAVVASALSLDGTWTNTGVITATNSGVSLGGSSAQVGTVVMPGSVLYVAGNFPAAQLAAIQYSPGAVRITTGALVDNTSNTLVLNASTGPWLMNGGTIRGGVVQTSGGAQLVFTQGNGSVLDGVTVNGDLDVGRSLVGAWARITNGLVLNGTLWVGNPTNANENGYVTFQGPTPTLSGTGTVVFGASVASVMGVETAGATLTIGPGILVRGQSGYIGSSGGFGPASSSMVLLNQGTISADVAGGMLTMNGQGFSNQGFLTVTDGAQLSLQDCTWANTGVITATNATLYLDGNSTQLGNIVASGSGLYVVGSFLAGQLAAIQSSLGTLVISYGGVVDNTSNTLVLNANTGSWVMNGGIIRGGVVTTSGGAQLVFTPGNGSVLDGVTVNGDMDVGRSFGSAWARITNGLVLNGTLWLGSPTNAAMYGLLTFQGITPSLSGSGTVVFGASLNSVMGVETPGATLTIGPGILVRGQSGYIGSSGDFGAVSSLMRLLNQGTISADVAGGTLPSTPNTSTAPRVHQRERRHARFEWDCSA